MCLKQAESNPWSIQEQICVLLALASGLFDPVPLGKVSEAEAALQKAAGQIPADVVARFESAEKVSDPDRKVILDIATRTLAPVQPTPGARKRRGNTKLSSRGTMAAGGLETKIRVRYHANEVTVRYFTPPPPPQRVPDRNRRVRYYSDGVTVRYLLPKIAVALPSTPNGSPARSVSRRDGSSMLTDIAADVRST